MKEELLKLINDFFDETGVINNKGERVVSADLLKFRDWLETQN